MKGYEGIAYNAVAIEHSLAVFLERPIGERGLSNDADTFRLGDKKFLSKLVDDIATQIEVRAKRISFTAADEKAKRKIDNSVRSLRELSSSMKSSTENEADDYHWIIVGAMAAALGAVLDHYGV